MITFLPVGGGPEIGANCYVLSCGGTGIILDCGMHPLKIGREALPDFSLMEDLPLDYCLISHAHHDHIGALPYLIQKFPHLKLISTRQTAQLSSYALHNSISIMKGQQAELDMPIYSHEEIDYLLRSLNDIRFHEYFSLDGFRGGRENQVTGRFLPAGHVLGAAGISIMYQGHHVFYTGDINFSKQILEPPAELPDLPVDTLIMECTLGDTDDAGIPQWGPESERFARIANAIITAGGSILVPVFSVGKFQEMMAMIGQLMSGNKLVSVPVFAGGLGKRVNNEYDRNRYIVPRMDPDFDLGSLSVEPLPEIHQLQANLQHEPGIYIASSGMVLPGTYSFKAAKEFMKHKPSAIACVGYMQPGTPGDILLKSNQGDMIRLTDTSEAQRVNCRIEKFRFSSHARSADLLRMVKKLHPANIILLHGSREAAHSIGRAILRDHKSIRVYLAEAGKRIIIPEAGLATPPEE